MLDFTTEKKYKKILVTISYYRNSVSYLEPISIYYKPYSGHSDKINIIKEGEIVDSGGGRICYSSYFLVDELKEGERFYAEVGFNVKYDSNSIWNKLKRCKYVRYNNKIRKFNETKGILKWHK